MTSITLKKSKLHCVLRPDLGGAIASLRLGTIPVLREVESPETVRDMGCFPLVPFSNRMAKAQLLWQGTNHPLIQMGAVDEHAIHGVAWQKPWNVLEAGDDFAMLSYRHTADSAWPFAFKVSQTFKLSSHSLSAQLCITNQSPSAAPVGLGWHPYFAKRTGMQLQFAATGRWDMGVDNLPTQLKPSLGLAVDCIALSVDHCFEGWTSRGVLKDSQLTVSIESNAPRLVAFTNPNKNFVALEPVSHVSNAFNRKDVQNQGVRILQSGESYSLEMMISLARS